MEIDANILNLKKFPSAQMLLSFSYVVDKVSVEGWDWRELGELQEYQGSTANRETPEGWEQKETRA